MLIKLGVLRQLIREGIADPPGDWKYFHITPEDLGPTFTFTPQTPAWNEYTDAEDFTTPRVSLSPSVEKAVHGKFGSLNHGSFGQDEMHVYACRSIPQLLVPRGAPELSTPGNAWGPDWSFKRYAEERGIEPTDENHAEVVKGRVSELSLDETGEVWSLGPIQMTLVGRLWPSKTGQPRIHQKWRLKTDT